MNIGGPAIQVTTLMRGIPESDFEQLLLIGEPGEGESDYLLANGIELPKVLVPGLGRRINIISDLRAFFYIWKKIYEFEPDIIHTHTSKAGFLGRLAALSQPKKYNLVHTFHGHLLYGYWTGVRLWLVVLVEKYLAKRTETLISVGAQVRDELILSGIGSIGKYSVVYPGFPMNSKATESSRPRPARNRKSKFLCIWVGRLVPIKRPERIIAVARLLRDRGMNYSIWVVGDGPLRKALEATANEENLSILFLGWRNDVHDLMTKCDVLLLTSDNEGTPVSIIEAQKLGRPVIATAIGSVKEVVLHKRSGFVLEFDAEDFVDRIATLAENPTLYNSFSNTARKFANETFSDRQLIDKHIHIYSQLLAT